MTSLKKILLIIILGCGVLGAILFINKMKNGASEGTTVDDYIARHGKPAAIADSYQPISGRLQGIQLSGVRLYSDTIDPKILSNRLLVYPESQDALRQFQELPNAEPIAGVRNVNYTPTEQSDERLTIAHVDPNGQVTHVESRKYDWFALREAPPKHP